MSEAHATLAPSAAAQWVGCRGSIAAVKAAGLDGDTSSEYAREGTAAHVIAARALDQQRDAAHFIGPEMVAVEYEEDGKTKFQKFDCDEEMAEHVQTYLDQVRREPGQLLVEQKLDLTSVYGGVEGQFGTADAIVMDTANRRLYVGDLKYGRGVQVFIKNNLQLIIYALGALEFTSLFGSFDKITVAIHQPRLNHYDEHTYSRDELEAFLPVIREAARAAMDLIGADADQILAALTAGEKQCQWCALKGDCKVQAEWVHRQVFEGFSNIASDPGEPRDPARLTDADLDILVLRADVIESATRGWRSELRKRLEAGIYAGSEWKLVRGRAGNRAWSDLDAAEKVMASARIKKADRYDEPKLKSPAKAEKEWKKKKPKVWAKLNALVTQAPGAPAVEPVGSPKPALEIAKSEQFENVSNDVSDLVGSW